MIIGYDGSRINVAHRTGTENYSYQILRNLLLQDQLNDYYLYSRSPIEDPLLQSPNLHPKVITLSRLWTQIGLAKEVALHQPDVLFVPAHTMPIIHRPSLKTVVTIHDLGAEFLPQYHQFPQKLYLNRATEFAAAHATHLIAVSQFTKQDLITKMKVDPARITVIYEGVDQQANCKPSDQDMVAVKAKYQLTQPYILFVGTIQPRKNLVRLIEAVSRLSDKRINLVLAGGKGWLSQEIYQAPQKYKVADRVKFLGYIPDQDKPALYAGAQVSALVSLFEGFGLPVLESMACGTPVIAANSSSLPEVVGTAGLLVDPLSVPAIAGGLEQLLTDTKLQQRCRAKGYEQVKQFTWEKAAAQTLQLLQKVSQQS